MKQLYDELDENLNIVSYNIKLIPGLVLPEGHTWVPHVPTLQEVKQDLLSQILSKREASCVTPVSAIGYTWQADAGSQSLLTQAILLTQLGVTPVPPTWRTLDNQDVPVTLEDLKAIALAIAVQVQTAYSLSWQQKATVEAATTIEELSWPI